MIPTESSIQVTKLDAAKRQLRTALQLWFAEGDPVSIHTLAAAAHELVHVIFRSKGNSGLLFDSKVVKEEYRSSINKKINATASFFKHANRDLEAVLELKPAGAEMLILYTLSGLQQIGEDMGQEGSAFMWWLFAHNPHLFTKEGATHRIPINVLEELRTARKMDFLEAARRGGPMLDALP